MFDRQASEQQNRSEGFEQPESDRASDGGGRAEQLGAAIWADICIPVVQPDAWPVYHLQMGLRQLERLRRETEAAMALLTGAMPESRDAVADIARNTGVSNREARRRKSVADVCGKVKGALEKLKSGAISNEHVSALAPVADMPGAASLLDDAESKSPEDLTRAVEEFRLSSACGNDMAKRQRARRYLRFFAGPEGTIGINGLLPPVDGTELKNRLAAIVDAQCRKHHPTRAKVLGGHADDTYDQRMADALLAIAGVPSQATSASSSPHGARTVDNAAAEDQGPPTAGGTQGPSSDSPQTHVETEANADRTSHTDNAALEAQRPPKATGTQHPSSGSSQTHVEFEAEDTTSAENLHRANRPSEALPMKVDLPRVGLRLVGLPAPPGTLGSNLAIPGLVNVELKRNGTDPDGDPPDRPIPGNEKSAGTIVKTAKPAVVIVFDVDRWKARIAGGGPIPITESLLDQARNDLYYCFKNTVGEVLKFARSRRDPTPIQKLVLVVRDEKCLYPGCHASPDACDAHHLNEVVKDKGNTDTDVMGLFCEAHHRHIHLNDLVVNRNPDASITIIERLTGTVVAVLAPGHPRQEAAA